MPSTRLEYLFDRFVNDKCIAAEEEELMRLMALPENEAEIRRLIDQVIENPSSSVPMPDDAAALSLQRILENNRGQAVPFRTANRRFLPWMRAAAAIIVVFAGIAIWLIMNGKKGNDLPLATHKVPVITPGGTHATLTMPNGKTIVLDDVRDVAFDDGSANVKGRNGVLVFNSAREANTNKAVAYNTLSTPKGGEYQVVLPDGSKVWLNASSSLRFPTAFTGDQREVYLTGEGYFEVAKNKEKAFKVKVGEMEIKVLGTHFNINAYEDEEAIKTSLLEGSVKITKGSNTNLLQPGQQGVVERNHNTIDIREVDMSRVMAWKNGLFQFEGADIRTIMREIGRWYDVEVVYAGKIPTRKFEGKISKASPLSDVLKILELNHVMFKIEGKKIIVQ